MSHQIVSADTEVVLLLCGRFGAERQDVFQPLSAREYGEFAKWLNGRGLRPADLLPALDHGGADDLHESGLERQRIAFLLGRGTALALALERWSRGGLWVISRGDSAFPHSLKRRLKHAAPPLLYGVGHPELLSMASLAIVGSRDASAAALDFTRAIAASCAAEGTAVVSGGARGVDTAAMQGATDAGGYAIGVLANDLLKSSVSRQHRAPLQEGRLVLVSPFYPEAGFNAGNAMARNKYIYALSQHALVIDSALKSGGTWAGAIENLARRWVPLYVKVPADGAGNAALIEQGALPFTFSAQQSSTLAAFIESTSRIADHAGGALPDHAESAPPAIPRHDSEDQPDAIAPLDMYADFLGKLCDVLAPGPLIEEQVAERLGLEKEQARAWLKKALDTGQVEKLGKPCMYGLAQQSSLIN